MVSLLSSQAEQVKAVALRIAQKYYGEPQRINARWQRRHGALEAPQQLEGVLAGMSELRAEHLICTRACWSSLQGETGTRMAVL
jgi:hypothetical protein